MARNPYRGTAVPYLGLRFPESSSAPTGTERTDAVDDVVVARSPNRLRRFGSVRWMRRPSRHRTTATAVPALSHPHHRRRTAAAVGVALATVVGAACTDPSEDLERPGAPTTTPERTAPVAAPSAPGDTSSAVIDRKAVDASFGRLDEIVRAAIDRTGTPGVAVAVVVDDEVVYTKGYGVRNTETNQPVEPDTVFQIASMSKPLSATIMAGAAGRGVFEWDDPIVKHSTRWALNDPWVTEHVTFADLFAHRSGLPGGVAGNDLESVGYDRAVILDRLRYVPLSPFRSTYSYSNFGMTLAGEVAAEAAGTTWEELEDQVLFEPAGMTSTSMRHADYVAAPNRADLHVEMDGSWRPAFERQPDAQAPAGGASSSVVDLARWVRLVLAHGKLDGTDVIDAGELSTTVTPHILRGPPPDLTAIGSFYGLGWNIDVDETGRVRWNHSGAFSVGASTTVKLLPAAGLGIIVLTNGEPIGVPEAITDSYLQLLQTGDDGIDHLLDLWHERFRGIYGEPETDWSTPPADPVPARPAGQYVGTYANDYVGMVTVAETAGGLELVVGPEARRFPLTHWSGDRWIYVHDPELPEFRATVDFTFSGESEAAAVTISAFNGAGLGTLART